MSLVAMSGGARLRVRPSAVVGQFVHMAELPRSTPSFTYSPPTGGTLHTPADAEALSTLLGAPNTTLQLGDIIELTAGVQYTSATYTQQTFPNVTTQRGGTSAAKIYVRTSNLASLPAAGVRVGGSITTVAGMATLKGYMPLFRQITSGGAPALRFANAAHGYVFSGIAADAGSVTTTSRIIELGVQGASAANHATDIVFERCYMAAETAANNCTRPLYIMASGAGIIVRDCWIFCEDGTGTGDDQAILVGRNNSGPALIENNFLAAAVENVMFGGDGPGPDGALIPADFTLRRNYFYKNPSWAGQKNLFELKCGLRVLLEDNRLEVFTGTGQTYALNLKSVNQTGDDDLVQTADIVARYNRWKDLRGALVFSGGEAESGGTFVQTARITYQHNLVEGHQFYAVAAIGRLANVNGVALWNNTFMADGVPTSAAFLVEQGGTDMTDLSIRDNIFHRAELGVKGDAVAEGTASLDGATSGGYEFNGNTIITTGGTYPAGQTRPADVAACGFTNAGARDYSLTGGSALLGTGYAGGDPGADIASVLSRTTGCVSGDWG